MVHTQYLQKIAYRGIAPEVENELKRSGLWRPEWAASAAPVTTGATTRGSRRPWICCGQESAPAGFFFVVARFFQRRFSRATRRPIAKFWKDPKVPELLAKLADALEALSEWNHDACRSRMRARLAEAGASKAGLLINAHSRRYRRSGGWRRRSSTRCCTWPAARSAPTTRCRGWVRQVLNDLSHLDKSQRFASPVRKISACAGLERVDEGAPIGEAAHSA